MAQTAKHAAASAKESVTNATAKTEEKLDKAKATTHEKLDKVMAHDKAGKEEAQGRKEGKVAEAKQVKHEKKADNAAETTGMKADIDRQHGAADTAAKTAHATGTAPVTHVPGAAQPLHSAAPDVNYGNEPLPSTGGNVPHAYGTAGAPAPTVPSNTKNPGY